MANSNVLAFFVVTLTVTQIVGLCFLHSLRQEKIGDSKSIPLISQATFNPPSSGKPKGSSGAGSRRIDSGKNKDVKS